MSGATEFYWRLLGTGLGGQSELKHFADGAEPRDCTLNPGLAGRSLLSLNPWATTSPVHNHIDTVVSGLLAGPLRGFGGRYFVKRSSGNSAVQAQQASPYQSGY